MPTGKTFSIILLMLLLLLIASNLQSGWIFALCAFITAELIISFIQNRLAIKHLKAYRTTPGRGEAGRPHPFFYAFEGAPPLVTVYEEGAPVKSSFSVSSLSEVNVFLSRGRYELKGFSVSTTYPSGWFSSKKWFEFPANLIIWPEKDLLSPSFAREIGLAPFAERGVLSQKGSEYAGIREYKAGDALKKIHWKKSAAKSSLFVREEAGTSFKKTAVFVNNQQDVSDELFEHCISAARSLIEVLSSSGFIPVLIFYQGQKLTVVEGSIEEMNDALAEMEKSSGTVDLESIPVELEGLVQEKAACFFITAGGKPPTCLGSFSEVFAVLIIEKGSEEEVLHSGRTIRVLIDGGKRQWVF